MNNDTLKVVMVGCGGMSHVWLKTAEEIENVQVVGLVDVNVDVAKSRAAEFGLTNAVVSTELRSVLESTSPDIVFDCTTPTAHTMVTVEALEHGCHVLGEKPLADSMDNARRSVAAAAKAGKLYAVMQNRRYIASIQRLRRLLNSGEIGQVSTLHSDFFIGAHFGGFRDRMRHVLLLDMSIHTFDAARFILGADPVSVWAKEWNPAGSWYDHDASAVAYFTMSNGIVYTYRGSWCSEGLNTSWECEWRAIGTRGSVKWDGGENIAAEKVVAQSGFNSEMIAVEPPTKSEQDRDGGHSGLIRDFIECVRTGETPETNAADNIKSLAMVFGAIESSETGKVVEIKI